MGVERAGGLLQQIWNPLSVLLPSPSVKSGCRPIQFPPTQWSVVYKDFCSRDSKPSILKLQISTLAPFRRFHLADVDALVSNINKLDRQCPVLPRFKDYFHEPSSQLMFISFAQNIKQSFGDKMSWTWVPGEWRTENRSSCPNIIVNFHFNISLLQNSLPLKLTTQFCLASDDICCGVLCGLWLCSKEGKNTPAAIKWSVMGYLCSFTCD